MTKKNGKITLALVGQPNTGKSTVFNQLTGSHQHVGNWPGKTVEQKTGTTKNNGHTYHVVDLPGTYSLTANSAEEIITRDYILNEHPDAVIVMVDASQIERTMYLLAESITFPVPVIMALNMIDVAEQEGRKIDVPTLQHHLGIPVVPMVATKKESVNELVYEVEKLIKHQDVQENPQPVWIKDETTLTDYLHQTISEFVPASYPVNWAILKLIEQDELVSAFVQEKVPADVWNSIQKRLVEIDDGPMLVAGARYQWIQQMLEHVVSRPVKDKSTVRRGKFDKIATHQFWGVLLSIVIFVLSFAVAMIIAMPFMGLSTSALPVVIESIRVGIPNAPTWFIAMLADGLVPGVGMALSFLGFMFGVFFAIGIIEDVGYMARVAFVADRFMNKIGLQGKSFMPMFSSFGCNITGVL
jgi:ferrous iron transport protein B